MDEIDRPVVDMDLLAASLRADSSDLSAFVESLASKLEGAVPGAGAGRPAPVGDVRAQGRFRAWPSTSATGASSCGPSAVAVQTRCARLSGGIVLKNEVLETDEWLAALSEALADEARRSETTRKALERLLMSRGGAMGFLKRDDDNTSAPAAASAPVRRPGSPRTRRTPRATRRARSPASPSPGRERIARMKQDVARGFFTSDLSVNEFVLVKRAGFEPLGLVLGSSIYHIGFQQAMWNQSQELGVLTQAMYHARELAMTRMEEEADQLGADGIVGVRLDIGRYEWGADLAEFIAVGTAVKHRGGELHRAPNGRPFTSDLSGQDFATLLRAGYRPVGLVMGNCVYHVGRQGMLASLKQVGRNVEMPNYTQALYEARELAMERMQREADELQSGGIVGARIIERSHGWGSHVIEFFAIGTAVVATSEDHEIEKPTMVLPLSG